MLTSASHGVQTASCHSKTRAAQLTAASSAHHEHSELSYTDLEATLLKWYNKLQTAKCQRASCKVPTAHTYRPLWHSAQLSAQLPRSNVPGLPLISAAAMPSAPAGSSRLQSSAGSARVAGRGLSGTGVFWGRRARRNGARGLPLTFAVASIWQAGTCYNSNCLGRHGCNSQITNRNNGSAKKALLVTAANRKCASCKLPAVRLLCQARHAVHLPVITTMAMTSAQAAGEWPAEAAQQAQLTLLAVAWERSYCDAGSHQAAALAVSLSLTKLLLTADTAFGTLSGGCKQTATPTGNCNPQAANTQPGLQLILAAAGAAGSGKSACSSCLAGSGLPVTTTCLGR